MIKSEANHHLGVPYFENPPIFINHHQLKQTDCDLPSNTGRVHGYGSPINSNALTNLWPVVSVISPPPDPSKDLQLRGLQRTSWSNLDQPAHTLVLLQVPGGRDLWIDQHGPTETVNIAETVQFWDDEGFRILIKDTRHEVMKRCNVNSMIMILMRDSMIWGNINISNLWGLTSKRC